MSIRTCVSKMAGGAAKFSEVWIYAMEQCTAAHEQIGDLEGEVAAYEKARRERPLSVHVNEWINPFFRMPLTTRFAAGEKLAGAKKHLKEARRSAGEGRITPAGGEIKAARQEFASAESLTWPYDEILGALHGGGEVVAQAAAPTAGFLAFGPAGAVAGYALADLAIDIDNTAAMDNPPEFGLAEAAGTLASATNRGLMLPILGRLNAIGEGMGEKLIPLATELPQASYINTAPFFRAAVATAPMAVFTGGLSATEVAMHGGSAGDVAKTGGLGAFSMYLIRGFGGALSLRDRFYSLRSTRPAAGVERNDLGIATGPFGERVEPFAGSVRQIPGNLPPPTTAANPRQPALIRLPQPMAGSASSLPDSVPPWARPSWYYAGPSPMPHSVTPATTLYAPAFLTLPLPGSPADTGVPGILRAIEFDDGDDGGEAGEGDAEKGERFRDISRLAVGKLGLGFAGFARLEIVRMARDGYPRAMSFLKFRFFQLWAREGLREIAVDGSSPAHGNAVKFLESMTPAALAARAKTYPKAIQMLGVIVGDGTFIMPVRVEARNFLGSLDVSGYSNTADPNVLVVLAIPAAHKNVVARAILRRTRPDDLVSELERLAPRGESLKIDLLMEVLGAMIGYGNPHALDLVRNMRHRAEAIGILANVDVDWLVEVAEAEMADGSPRDLNRYVQTLGILAIEGKNFHAALALLELKKVGCQPAADAIRDSEITLAKFYERIDRDDTQAIGVAVRFACAGDEPAKNLVLRMLANEDVARRALAFIAARGDRGAFELLENLMLREPQAASQVILEMMDFLPGDDRMFLDKLEMLEADSLRSANVVIKVWTARDYSTEIDLDFVMRLIREHGR